MQSMPADTMVRMSPNPLPLTPQQLKMRAGRVCMALSGPAMLREAERNLLHSRFFEFRLDSVTDPYSILANLGDFFSENNCVTAIATCRLAANGGGFQGSATEQIDILTRAARSGCRLADIEIDTAEELGSSALDDVLNAGAAVILSWHDFAETPDLPAVLKRMQSFAPDFLKIVPTARTLRDALHVIDLLEHHGDDGRLIAMSMGQKGVLTRVL